MPRVRFLFACKPELYTNGQIVFGALWKVIDISEWTQSLSNRVIKQLNHNNKKYPNFAGSF